MTLVLTVQTRDSIWIAADRRLSASGRILADDAIKIASLETADGVALIGYSGLGRTAFGNEPSGWVSNVLRGRRLPLEDMLAVLAEAMNREFPPHLNTFQDPGHRVHSFIVPAFVNDQPQIYSIDVANTPEGYKYCYTRFVLDVGSTTTQVCTSIHLAGSGAAQAWKEEEKWRRPLLGLIKAYNYGKVSDVTVAGRLASVAYLAHEATKETVGPDCTVVWRASKQSLHGGSGGFQFFSNRRRINDGPIPTISNGLDVAAFVKVVGPHFANHFENLRKSREEGIEPPSLDSSREELNRKLARLPLKPDEKLR